MSGLDLALAASRSAQYAGAAILGGTALFFLYAGDAAPRAWRARLLAGGAAAGALGAVAWLMAQAGQLGAAAASAFDPAAVGAVAAGTSFGRVGLARAGLFVAGALAVAGLGGRARWLAASACGLAAAASFVWTGHGGADGAWWHMLADAVHLVAATVWLGALVGLAALGLAAARSKAAAGELYTGMVRFSAIGVAVVAALAGSGLVNTWALVGPQEVARLPESTYGRLLLAKLAAFVLMLVCAGWNRYRHTAALAPGGELAPTAVAAPRATLLIETALGLVVVALAAWLGGLAPPNEG